MLGYVTTSLKNEDNVESEYNIDLYMFLFAFGPNFGALYDW